MSLRVWTPHSLTERLQEVVGGEARVAEGSPGGRAWPLAPVPFQALHRGGGGERQHWSSDGLAKWGTVETPQCEFGWDTGLNAGHR